MLDISTEETDILNSFLAVDGSHDHQDAIFNDLNIQSKNSSQFTNFSSTCKSVASNLSISFIQEFYFSLQQSLENLIYPDKMTGTSCNRLVKTQETSLLKYYQMIDQEKSQN
jgi:hypothetical protein